MTITEIIKKYRIHVGGDGTQLACEKAIAKKPEDVEFVKAHKQEIIAYIEAEAEATVKAAQERNAKIAAIEGLNELRNAIAEHERYNRAFSSFIAHDCIGKAPVKPESDIATLKARYPRAAAYLKAEAYEFASNYAKAAAGKKALERIIEGEDYSAVIADMEAEWKAHCEEHIWD